MEQLITSLATSLKDGQITNNIADNLFKRNPQHQGDYVFVAKTLAMVLQDCFLDFDFRDVYPYCVFYMQDDYRKEASYVVGFKGQTIEFGNIDADAEAIDLFREKLTEAEHHFYDMFAQHANKHMVAEWEYKEENMQRSVGPYANRFPNEFGRSYESAVICSIPLEYFSRWEDTINVPE